MNPNGELTIENDDVPPSNNKDYETDDGFVEQDSSASNIVRLRPTHQTGQSHHPHQDRRDCGAIQFGLPTNKASVSRKQVKYLLINDSFQLSHPNSPGSGTPSTPRRSLSACYFSSASAYHAADTQTQTPNTFSISPMYRRFFSSSWKHSYDNPLATIPRYTS